MISRCVECRSIDVDIQISKNYSIQVCRACAKKIPEKYALLTKTECREDYLLTDPELSDRTRLDVWEKKNPHSGAYSNMLLFIRCQVELYA
jgi:DNA-repair protein complementing XP-A cells